MSRKKRADVLQWHAVKVNANYIVNLKNDMKAYCESDVKLLKAGCEYFVKEFYKQAEFNLLEKYITIASACSRYWRKKQLPPRTVAVEPPQGWNGAQSNQSFAARQWMSWKNHQLERESTATADRIRHNHNGGEVHLIGQLVDGFDQTTNTVYEFNGCFFHGCPRCYPTKRFTTSRKRSDRSLQECYNATKLKATKLENAGYHLVTMWEYDCKRECKTNPEVASFLSRKTFVTPLNPRDAFFGGRTDAVKLHHTVELPDEKIHFQDVTSLYPWVSKYGVYPIGHPQIIKDIRHTDISQFFGMAKVTILPPYDLYHPVLPLRQGGKLTFPLCRTCVGTEMAKPMTQRTQVCRHSWQERQILGTWCTPELEETVRQGYHIRAIHEVWHFPPNQ